MKNKESIIMSTSRWIANHGPHLDDDSLQALANVIPEDFVKLPKLSPTHQLQTSGICSSCTRRGITINGFSTSFERWATNILDKRPPADPSLDQAPIGLSQALLNISYFLSVISNESSFAFLGDDDFHSLLLAKLLPGLSITVFEADPRIITAINDIARQEFLKVSVVNANMRQEIPTMFHGQFDAFYTDPPYSKFGAMLFLYRGIQLLAKKRASWGVIALPYTVLPLDVREMLLSIQMYLLQNGFLIEESIPFFKRSPNPLGILSGIMKCQRIEIRKIVPPKEDTNLYNHFYGKNGS